ncbi:hypothetical protein [Gellertiella hungarica]|uniref:Uncharacterized protein n=1 Tax=Gellertiella hungarica TaxID=1572859 RepID=A0A7W6J3D0_9HYPH|nr:hypothetical protein [Gellertiella hungarica]MBB4064066.1 hypothetical protein [Gellertiella hungarica]
MDTRSDELYDDIAVRVRDVVRTLRRCGISHAVTASAIGVSERTLKAYWSRGQNRRHIGPDRLTKLNRMADEAIRRHAALVEGLAA